MITWITGNTVAGKTALAPQLSFNIVIILIYGREHL